VILATVMVPDTLALALLDTLAPLVPTLLARRRSSSSNSSRTLLPVLLGTALDTHSPLPRIPDTHSPKATQCTTDPRTLLISRLVLTCRWVILRMTCMLPPGLDPLPLLPNSPSMLLLRPPNSIKVTLPRCTNLGIVMAARPRLPPRNMLRFNPRIHSTVELRQQAKHPRPCKDTLAKVSSRNNLMEPLPTAVARQLQPRLLNLLPLALVLAVMTGKATGTIAPLVTKPWLDSLFIASRKPPCARISRLSGKAQLSLFFMACTLCQNNEVNIRISNKTSRTFFPYLAMDFRNRYSLLGSYILACKFCNRLSILPLVFGGCGRSFSNSPWSLGLL
jgi:hypothetical protein